MPKPAERYNRLVIQLRRRSWWGRLRCGPRVFLGHYRIGRGRVPWWRWRRLRAAWMLTGLMIKGPR